MTNGKPVVLGVDYSPVMLRTAPWVREWITPGASFVVVHATEEISVPPFLRHLLPPADARDLAHRDDEARLVGWRDAVGLHAAEAIVREGRADQVLRQVASDARADLVVLGAHGGRTRPWMRLGTTAERLLRAAESSLLVTRGPMSGPPRRILVAVDDVEITPKVLAIAGELADRLDARIHGLHVLSIAAYSHLLSAEAVAARSDAERRAKVEEDLAEETLRWIRAMWASTRRHGKLEAEVAHGVPGDEILRAAGKYAADLIVMGRYGAGRVVPAVLGSAVGSVVAGAECPVLVVAR